MQLSSLNSQGSHLTEPSHRGRGDEPAALPKWGGARCCKEKSTAYHQSRESYHRKNMTQAVSVSDWLSLSLKNQWLRGLWRCSGSILCMFEPVQLRPEEPHSPGLICGTSPFNSQMRTQHNPGYQNICATVMSSECVNRDQTKNTHTQKKMNFTAPIAPGKHTRGQT